MWKRRLKWDDKLPADLNEIWEQWCLELPDLKHLSIPRCHFPEELNVTAVRDDLELHGFCDSSQTAYGAVVYLRCEFNGKCIVSFVSSKSRVAPLKEISLPRLELMGAVILTRIMKLLKEVFRIDSSRLFYWSDSEITLNWIKGPPEKWKPFVAHRVAEIQADSSRDRWRHCPGSDNPADKITRGKKMHDLIIDKQWWHGPDWLSAEQSKWPDKSRMELKPENYEPAIKCELKRREKAVLQIQCNETKELLNPNDYSSWTRLIRITAWILKFIKICQKMEHPGALSSELLQEAEIYWIKGSQDKRFRAEILALRERKPLISNSCLIPLNPFLDSSGILRVGGRMQQSCMTYSEKHPCILSPDEAVTNLVIKNCHAKVLHNGVRDTLTQLREKYWVLKGRSAVKTVLKACLRCKRYKAKAATQDTAPLPRDRLTEAPPFDVTGTDFAGPVYVRGRTQADKSYIALFTCAVTRALHLELVSDLTSESFLLAFRRFISRRGICSTLYCDNAQTFKRTERDLKELWKNINSPEAKDFFGSQGIRFKYIVERAPWWGGFYERMVKSVKTTLRKILGRAMLRYEEVETILTEIEAMINSRPITYVYDDAHEPTPLTPAQLLIGQRINTLPTQHFSAENLNASRDQITRRLKYRQNIVRSFWKRWRNEYLGELMRTHRTRTPKTTNTLQANDVVLVADDKIGKHMWKLGRVIELFTGRDTKIRACSVKLGNNVIIRRPVQLLHPLEIEH